MDNRLTHLGQHHTPDSLGASPLIIGTRHCFFPARCAHERKNGRVVKCFLRALRAKIRVIREPAPALQRGSRGAAVVPVWFRESAAKASEVNRAMFV